jgi:Polysaccharide lyase family 4, domain II
VKVVLIPDAAHRQRNDLYQTTVSDDSGRFRFEHIPPGDYALFAWEDIEDGIWRDAEFLRRYAGSGRPLHIVEGGRETVEIVAIPPLGRRLGFPVGLIRDEKEPFRFA